MDMRIEKAQELGLCFGVRRAIELLTEAAREHGQIETLGPLAHNRLLVDALAARGVKPVRDLDAIRGRVVAITTHGTSPETLAEMRARHIHTIDATCPTVRKAQNTVRELAVDGLDVIIFGDAEHAEVRGLLGCAGGRGIAVLNMQQIEEWVRSRPRLGIVSQTTQTRAAFIGFVAKLVSLIGPVTKEMRFADTLCRVTQAQQEAAIELARKSQLMIVIGGGSSANARHLVEMCSSVVETHLVETIDDVDQSWLSGKHHVGITAGASTPDDAVDELIAALRSL
jgi:4-hydroxy-3-methylbut-2-en-1-yl diphosphate reductase